ncbi:sel1 repeat family protein [Mesorhizobium sp. WSM2240]|uniref:Sel1 repeat family protein n=1 Tax=Mesorhizobium sp. WSM2240 TaxID=3228851 RepID=A0AAU8CY18_9HYPH
MQSSVRVWLTALALLSATASGVHAQTAAPADPAPAQKAAPETKLPAEAPAEPAQKDVTPEPLANTPATVIEDPAAPAASGPLPAGVKPLGIDPTRFGGPRTADGKPDPARFGAKPADAAFGAFQRGLTKTAYNLALVRAENGDPAAQTLVAEILSRGLGMARNEAEAAKWYARATEQGVPEAQFQYALMLLDGRFVKKDPQGAYALMQAAAEAGNRLAQFNFAQMLVDRETGAKGLEKAVSYYEHAAKSGLADAQYAMAQICANGVGGKARNEKEARRWLVLAARQNFDTAQLDLGTWLIDGRGGGRNMQEGFGWMRRAAAGGNVAAQNRLAKLYMKGLGVDPDPIAAAAWYILARRAGLTDPEMEDFFDGLTDEELKKGLERANRLR